MAKRTASTDLNHLNWNQEEEPEDAGVFKKASEEAIKKRVIKTARRRNPISASSETPTSSIFGNFSGFSSKPAPAPSTAFSFLNNLNKDKETPTANGTNMFVSPKSINSPLFKVDTKKDDKVETDEYLVKVKSLNESVANWIKSKVDHNPYVDLKPIFKDYEKYFEDLKKDSDKNDTKTDTSNTKSDLAMFSFKPIEQKEKNDTSKPLPFSSVNQGKSNEKMTESEPPKTSLFTLGSKQVDKKPTFTFGLPNKEAEPPKFSFGIPASTTTTTPMFSFGSNAATTSTSSGFTLPTTNSAPFTFANITKPAASEDENKNEEEDEEPPKHEFTPVVEEGHVYTTRCKVFVKNDEKFGDRGVGTLYLKPVPNSEKVQLIIRADTSLGNLLCNFILSKSIPTKRMGKKDVMLVTVPTPDSKPPPVPILLRVKSPEEADQLLTELEKHKK